MNAPEMRSTILSSDDVHLARESLRTLAGVLQSAAESHRIDVYGESGVACSLRVPASALRLLCQALGEMERGYAVAVTSVDADLTTQQAADVLNVSRPYLVRLLEQGQIPFHKTGSHRRVRHRDLMAYKRQVDAQRLQVLDALTAQAQELGLGY